MTRVPKDLDKEEAKAYIERDHKLKIACLEAAFENHNQNIGLMEHRHMPIIMYRARMLYEATHRYNFDNWDAGWTGYDQFKSDEENEERPTVFVEDGMKVCPKCGEQVPEGWETHETTEAGEKCGYVFDMSGFQNK